MLKNNHANFFSFSLFYSFIFLFAVHYQKDIVNFCKEAYFLFVTCKRLSFGGRNFPKSFLSKISETFVSLAKEI
jgi:hypothetical protein